MDVALGYFSDDGNDGSNYDLTKPPSSGIEYLKRVQMEATQYPDVVTYDNSRPEDNIEVSQERDLTQIDSDTYLNPSETDQLKLAADFACLRQTLNRYKSSEEKSNTYKLPPQNEKLWCLFCLGRSFYKDFYGCEPTDVLTENFDIDTGHAPLLSIISKLNQPLAFTVLEYHLKWFQLKGFTAEQGRWFFGLLLCIDKPTPSDVVSVLRELVRECLTYRKSAAVSIDDVELINQLNLFPVIVSKYFGQTDLTLKS